MALTYAQIYAAISEPASQGGNYQQQILVALWIAVGPVYANLQAGQTIVQDPQSVKNIYGQLSGDAGLPFRVGFLVSPAALANDSDASVQSAINALFPGNNQPFSF
jgi:hypothetical protein